MLERPQIGTASLSAASVPLIVSRFDTAFPKGPALGTMERTCWGSLAGLIGGERREGEKDGNNIALARFEPEGSGKVRRLKANLLGRTAIALDCETNKATGEVPPRLADVVAEIQHKGWAAVVYTSHNHRPDTPRYRILLPLTAEIAPSLPAVEVIADLLNLRGVLDESKLGAASLFYLPSCAPGQSSLHDQKILDGKAIDAAWMRAKAGAILDARECAQAQQRADALAAAEARRKSRLASGFKPSDNLIETIRERLDLVGELLRHGYKQVGDRFLYSGSETGIPGVHVLRGGDGVDRVFSHHSGDPLAACNLPSWCGVKAIDVVDVVTVLDFGGDQKRALHTLAKQFGIGEQAARVGPEEPPGFSDVPLPNNDDQLSVNEEPSISADEKASAKAEGGRTHTWEIVNPVHLQGRVVPEREWIVQDWLPIGVVTANYGDGGTGKTLLSQQLQTCCAVQIPWCGLAAMQCRSIGLYCEDDEEELHRRQARICDAHAIGFEDLGAMRWISGVGHDNTLVAYTADGRLKATSILATLRAATADHGARLVILDTAADLFPGNENDRQQVRQFIAALNKIAKEQSAAVLLNAHPSRSGIASGNLDGGSTAWSNSVRSRWSLARPPGEEENPGTHERILTRRKANYAGIGETIKLCWADGVLTAPQRPSRFAAMSREAEAEAVFLTLLAATEREGRPVSAIPNAGTFAPREFGRRGERQGFTSKDFQAAMERLFAAGKIKAEEYGRPGSGGKPRRIVEVAR